MLTAERVTCTSGVLQMVRYDEMSEKGIGIAVMCPISGGIFVNCREDAGDRDGLAYLLKELRSYANEFDFDEYKIKQAYFALKCGNNYDRKNVKVRMK